LLRGPHVRFWRSPKICPGDNGFGEGEDRLELAKDTTPQCPARTGFGRQRIGVWLADRAVR